MDQVLPIKTEEQESFFDKVVQDVENDIHNKASQMADMAVPAHADESEARRLYSKAYHNARNAISENYKDLKTLVDANVNDRINRGDDIPLGISPEVDARVAAIKKALEDEFTAGQEQQRTSIIVNVFEKDMIAAYAKEHGMPKGQAKGVMREKGLIPSKDAGVAERAAWHRNQIEGPEAKRENEREPQMTMEMA